MRGKMTSAIDKTLGLRQYEGDEAIYRNVLKTFARSNRDTLERLRNAVACDSRLARRIAHSMRGAAGTIGAARLAEAALTVESLLSPADTEHFAISAELLDKHLALFESEYRAVYDELEPLLDNENDPEHGHCSPNREKTLALADKLAPLLKAGDAACLEYLDDIKKSFGSTAEIFRLFIAQMEQFDFDRALETLNSIQGLLKPGEGDME